MSWLDEFDDEASLQDANTFAPPRPKEPEKPSLFAGAGQLPKAIPSGLSKVGAVALNNSPTNIIADTLGYAYYRGKAAINDQEAIPFDEFYTIQQEGREEFGKTAIDAYKLDPQKTGAATNVLFQLGDVVTQAGAGGILTGGIGGAATVAGAGVGNASFLEQMERGVDRNTATKVGIAEGVATGIGVALPVSRIVPGSGLAVRAADAAVSVGGAVGIGMGMRGANNAILDDAGYKDQAKRYDPFDKTSIAIDLTLASLFHGGSVYLGSRASQVTPEQVAAALTASQEAHARSVAPVPPATAADTNAHLSNLDSATNSLLTGAPVNVTRNINSSPALSLPGQANRIADAAQQAGINPQTALVISHIETGGRFNPDAQNPTSSANGLYQVIDSTWKRLKGGDRADVNEQIRVGFAHIREVSTTLQKALKRAPAVHEEYMGHLLGPGGASKVLTADPNARLYDVVYAYTKAKTEAQRVKIAKAVVNNNGMKDLTVGQAIAKWKNKTEQVQAKIGNQPDATLARAADDTPESIVVRDDEPLLTDTPSQRILSDADIRANNLRDWYGQDGEPTIMYHGSPRDWAAWDTEQGGGLIHLTDNPDVAYNYSQGSGGGRGAGSGHFIDMTGNVFELQPEGTFINRGTGETVQARQVEEMYNDGDLSPYNADAVVKPLYTNVRNPLDLTTPEGVRVLSEIQATTPHGANVVNNAKNGDFNWSSTKHERINRHWQKDLVPKIKALGYDGLRFNDDGHKTLSAFDASQIKSADKNTGGFSRDNPDIYDTGYTPKQPDTIPTTRDTTDNPASPIDQAAADILATDPDMQIGVARINAEGETEIITMSIREAMEQADTEIKAAQEQGVAAQAAASCALRFGA